MSEARKRDLKMGTVYLNNGEDETEAGLLKVRALLSSLPKESCPAGFEYRLNRRLQGLDERPRAAAKSWISGWMGVGLGFAAATVIALFAFDLNLSSDSASKIIAQSDQKTAPVKPEVKDENVATQQPTVPVATSPQEHDKLATTDSVQRKDDPTYVSPNRLQQASSEAGAVSEPISR